MLISYLRRYFLNFKEAQVLKKNKFKALHGKRSKKNSRTIKSFRSDDGLFKISEFKADIDGLDQTITYCGVSAHHQNGIVERYIRTMVDKARTALLNAHARWSKRMKMEL